MPLSPIFVRRSLRDTNNIAKVTIRAATRVSYKIRARYIESLRSGGKNKFKVKPYVLEQLRGIYVMSAMAAHLSGYRRLFLIRRQTPALMRKLMEQEAQRDPLTLSFDNPQLLLSELGDALSVLTKRTFLDINELQEKYDTRALKVLNDTSAAIEEQLDETFKRLLKEGSTVNNAIKELGTKFDELGLSPKKPYQLETIFRTQLQLSFNAGRYQAEQHPDIQEILWGYKYVSVGDDRVRPEHEAIDGVTLPKDDAFWQRFYPPNGWNCRCQVIPLFEEREIQKPPELDDNGNPIAPDKDFNFNPGIAFSAPATEPASAPASKPASEPASEPAPVFDNLKDAEDWAKENGAPLIVGDAKSAANAIADQVVNGPWKSERMKEYMKENPISAEQIKNNWEKEFNAKKETQQNVKAFQNIREDVKLRVQTAINDNHTNKAFADIESLHGKMPVLLRQQKKGDNAAAEYIGGAIHYYDASLINDAATSKPGSVKPGDGTAGSIGGIAAELRHEYGHGLYEKLGNRELENQWRERYSEVFERLPKELTSYSAKNAEEFWCEAFAIMTDRHFDEKEFSQDMRSAFDYIRGKVTK